MKRMNWLLVILATVALLAACQQSNDRVTNEANNTNIQEEEKPNPNEGKATKSVEAIKEASLLDWELDDGLMIYLVNVDGTIERHESSTGYGLEGEEFFTGQAALYLVYDGDEIGYLQEEAEIDILNLNESGKLAAFNLEEDAFIAWKSPIATNIDELFLWTIKEEELAEVTFDGEAGISLTADIRTNDQGQIQFYRYLNQDPSGYYIYTYDWQPEDNDFTLAAELLPEEDELLTELIAGLWRTNDDFFLPTVEEERIEKPYKFTEKDIDLFKEGKLIHEEIQLGDSLAKAIKLLGAPAGSTYFSTAPAIFYEQPAPFMYAKNPDEDKFDLIALALDGSAVKSTLAELRDLLGPAESDAFNMLEESMSLEYNFGDYKLIIDYDKESEEVYNITLL